MKYAFVVTKNGNQEIPYLYELHENCTIFYREDNWRISTNPNEQSIYVPVHGTTIRILTDKDILNAVRKYVDPDGKWGNYNDSES